ncbi:MAG: ATP-binding protein [Methanocellales archaeon]|nr:ATP-binding protein [Methanocellales archaeon]MDD3292172.1 ATP-binding protein [Methanocellales archaeon]MDD5235761.1 ATP-binding protein [Methanocellales archaeon]MDD5485826.1 ATP-binding protein [Methanocellales archaeon]
MEGKNPFSPTFPVNTKYFANREDILSSFRRSFDRSKKTEMPTPDNIAVLGDCGVGKTSVLRKFEAIALEEFKERKVFSAIVGFTPISCNSFNSILNKIVDEISGNFVTNTLDQAEMKNEIKDWRAKSIGTSEAAKRDESATRIFRDTLIGLWKTLEKRGIDTGLLMLDDVHYLSRCPDALSEIRAVFQELPKNGCNFILCITGRSDLFSDIRGYGRTFANFFNIKHTLNPFKLNEVKDAILTPLKMSGLDLTVNESVIERIHDLTRGHPVFINFIMRELVYLKREGRITLEDFEKNYRTIMKSMERERFKNDFSISSGKEKEILLAMSKLPDRFSPSDISIKDARTHLRFLIKKGLIVKHERGAYSLYHPFFKEYLRSLGENE